MEHGAVRAEAREMRIPVLLVAPFVVFLAVACRKSNTDDATPVVKAPPSECEKLLARLGQPACKAPAVDATELDVAQTMGMASLDGDSNLRDAHEKNCAASNAQLDKYKECAPAK